MAVKEAVMRAGKIKPSLVLLEFSKCWLVLNLPVVGKMFEYAVASHLQGFLDETHYLD